MKTKRVYLNLKKTKYCQVYLFKTKKQMQSFYAKHAPKDKNHYKVLGVSIHRDYYKKEKGRWKILPRTGEVLLSLENCGAAVVAHELMHATIWAFRHNGKNKQYPFVIESMNEEEKLLHAHSQAVMQFYNWYWKVKKTIK